MSHGEPRGNVYHNDAFQHSHYFSQGVHSITQKIYSFSTSDSPLPLGVSEQVVQSIRDIIRVKTSYNCIVFKYAL